jgi:hypothetical protein
MRGMGRLVSDASGWSVGILTAATILLTLPGHAGAAPSHLATVARPFVNGAAPASVGPLADPGVDHAHVPHGSIFLSSTTNFVGFPALYNGSSTNGAGIRNSRLTLGYNTQRDAVGAGAITLRQSTDGGATWPSFPAADGELQPMNFVRLAIASGGVIGIDFQDLSLTDTSCTDLSICRRQFNRRMMTPTGWVDAGTATVTFSRSIAWSRFHQGPILLGDAKTLLATMYGRYSDLVWFTVVVRSTDGGVTWTEASQLATSTAQGWGEASLAPTSDGGLLAVIRKDENFVGARPIPSNVALYVRRSANQTGAGPWDAPVRLSSDGGNSPSVELMGNGTLVLASGRNDNQLRFSYDGRGTTWTAPAVPYVNYPTTGGDPDGWYTFRADATGYQVRRPMRHLGSSGTLGVESIAANRLLVVGDNCGSGWGCPCPWGEWACPHLAGGYTVGSQHALWKSVVEVDTGQWGKVDLARLFQRGELTVLDPTFSRYGYCPGDLNGCRQSYAAFAFDGDPRTDSSLVTPNRSVTLRLSRAYDVTALGLHAHLQGASDIQIETSVDGANWITPARGSRDGIIRPFTAPVAARYIRISDPNTIIDSTAAFLHEVELYTTADGFENDYPGQAPRGNGLAEATMATVVEQSTVSAADRISSRFLRIKDMDPNAQAKARWTHAPSTTATIDFKVHAYGSSNTALLFGLLGKDGTTTVDAYHLMLTAGGYLHRWDAASKTWGSPLNATPLTVNSWNSLRVVATAGDGGQAQLWAGGQLVATVAQTTPTTSLDSIQVASGGTPTTGDDWLIDDVTYTT